MSKPVSYTHLFGREYRSVSFSQNTDGKDVIFEIIQPLDMQTVSYTHLDVYKRQVSGL